ncbi:hypothetical protein VTP01DRAFT_5339 [Rhizomucor pusillus]|uniref:uncharacterized protein n=1 Tax=Rhizomucor pusillus TaxID=4840 RepID=UPI003744444F
MQRSLGAQFVIPPQSPSAIPIVAPSESPSSNGTAGGDQSASKSTSSKTPSKGKTNTKRLCRNVIIHGFCKFEDKGCEFNHDVNKPSPQGSPEVSTRFRTQSSTGRSLLSMPSSVSADSINAPVFVPRSATLQPASTEDETNEAAATENVDQSQQQQPSQEEHTIEDAATQGGNLANNYIGDTQNLAALTNSFSQFSQGPSTVGPSLHAQAPQSPSHMLASMGMIPHGQIDPYYYMNAPVFHRQPLQYHLYTNPLPHVSKLLPHQRSIQSFFISDELREELTQKNEMTLMTAPAARELGLPEEVHVYHSLYPLDEPMGQPGQFFGHPSWVYKAVSSVDGKTYTLLRIEGFRLVNELAMSAVESWRRIRHCGVVSIHEAFTTRAFGDSSLIFVYDYFPCSTTLNHTYFTPQGQAALHARMKSMGSNSVLIPETTLWSYITQITSALKTIHGSGLAARNIDLSKIIITGKHRHVEKINSLGQQEDLLAFGKIILALACNSTQSFHNLPQSFEFMSRYYSPDLKNVVLYLLSQPMPTKTIDEVVTLIGPRILHEINSSHSYNDALESELSRELENGRLVRLMAKMGFINERPEFDMDPSWSETGDRYIIKLFRDYVFHQVDENGVPVVNMVHVLTCLNKLDAGVDEKIMLMSRDEQSCLIIMSADLVWTLVKNNNSFLVKRPGVQFSAEKGNLMNLHSYKYSGLANAKTVDIRADGARGVRVTTKKVKKANLPSKVNNVTVISRSRRGTAKAVANLVARSKYRPDLREAALARASAVITSQQPKKEKTRPAGKGLRAQKAAAKQA